MDSSFNNLINNLSLNNNQIHENDDTDEKIKQKVLIKELFIESCDRWFKNKSETWKCAFSLDENYFAWSLGFQMVTLVPKAVYLNKNAPLTGLLTINCGQIIRSLIFINVKDILSNTLNFWPKSAKCKSLFLVTGHQNGSIRIWDIIEGKLLLKLNDHKNIVTELATNSFKNNLLISSSYDGTVKIRDLLNEGNILKVLKLDNQQVDSVQVCSNNKLLAASGSFNTIYIWKLDDYSLLFKLSEHLHRVSSICFSSDGKRLASVSFDTTCIVWNLITGQKIIKLNHLLPPPQPIFASGENGHWIKGVCFASDNNHLLTVCDDGFVRIWDLDDVKKPEIIYNFPNAISCKYSPTSNFFAIGKKNGNVIILRAQKCVKSLLTICRTEICKKNIYELNDGQNTNLPKELINYLNYE